MRSLERDKIHIISIWTIFDFIHSCNNYYLVSFPPFLRRMAWIVSEIPDTASSRLAASRRCRHLLGGALLLGRELPEGLLLLLQRSGGLGPRRRGISVPLDLLVVEALLRGGPAAGPPLWRARSLLEDTRDDDVSRSLMTCCKNHKRSEIRVPKSI